MLMCDLTNHNPAAAMAITPRMHTTTTPTTTQTQVLTLPATIASPDLLCLRHANWIVPLFADRDRLRGFPRRRRAIPLQGCQTRQLEMRPALHPERRVGAKRLP